MPPTPVSCFSEASGRQCRGFRGEAMSAPHPCSWSRLGVTRIPRRTTRPPSTPSSWTSVHTSSRERPEARPPQFLPPNPSPAFASFLYLGALQRPPPGSLLLASEAAPSGSTSLALLALLQVHPLCGTLSSHTENAQVSPPLMSSHSAPRPGPPAAPQKA